MKPLNYHILTLGCPKNAVDSEGMDSVLRTQGHRPVERPTDADVVIVNTCSFIAAAREETLQVLREFGAQKQPEQQLIAAGCMAESHPDLVQAVPGVDATLSTRQWMQVGDLVARLRNTEPASTPSHKNLGIELLPMADAADTSTNAINAVPLLGAQDTQAPGYADWRTAQIRRSVNGPSAYLKISDGCNLRCAFCTIPSFKGDMRSKPVGAILGEAQELVALGVREIVLVAQHLTDYGRDLQLKDGLATLLAELCGVLPDDIWLRLMYAYPHGITPALIETMARYPQICAYLDMPLQHAHPDTLRRMRRPPDTERTKQTIAAMRAAMPDLTLRSTFIVGFPGETRTEFEALLAFLEEVQLDWVGVFQYSREPGTHAATLPDQVPQRIIERRWHEVMQLQQPITYLRNQRWEGRLLDVLVEGHGSTEDGEELLVGRAFRNAPEVDGQVFVWGNAPVGTIVRTTISQATAYDLWGQPAMAESTPLRMPSVPG